jgi:hypothetical protein
MPLTNAGATAVAVLVEATGNHFVAVGNSSTAFNASQTDLLGTNARVAGSVSRSGSTLTVSGEFGTGVGNFFWNEIGYCDAASAGTLYTRKVVSLPEKTSSETWTINLEVVFAAA